MQSPLESSAWIFREWKAKMVNLETIGGSRLNLSSR
jgi:hypothetical protein